MTVALPAPVGPAARAPGALAWLPWAVFAALAARLYLRTSDLAVNLPFWDQWDFWQPQLEDAGPLVFFRWQHVIPGLLACWVWLRATHFEEKLQLLRSRRLGPFR